MCSPISPSEEFSQGLVRFAYRRRASGLGAAGSKEFCCERGREDAERLGIETDFRFREERAARAAFVWTWVTREICCYILTVRGSVSWKLRADSAGRTISFSPV